MVMMIDPDAPNHGPGEFYLHWMVLNIPGYVLKQGLGNDVADIAMGEKLSRQHSLCINPCLTHS